MVLPGFAGTHDHPMDWDTINPYIIRKVVTDDMHVERFFNVPAEEVVRDFPRVLDEAVRKAKPGQWIRISVLFGPDYRWGDEIMALFGRQINKQLLDAAAPNNPVQVRGGFTGMVVNQRAIEAVRKYYGAEIEKFVDPTIPFPRDIEQTGVDGTNYRYYEQDVIFPPDMLREIYRLGLSWMTGYGMTMNGSSLYTAGAIRAYTELDARGQMAQRFAWDWYWPPRKDFFLDPYLPVAVAAMNGKGSDYLWMNGAVPALNARACSTLPGTSPEVKERERNSCAYDPNTGPGRLNRDVLYNYIKAGGRLAGDHTGGDLDVDYTMDIIEQASKDAGMTIEQIRTKRHAYDHMHMSPRPEQIPRIKNLGMIVGGYNLQVYEGGAAEIYRDYGEQAVEWIQPRKSLLQAGVMNSVEIDRPIGYTNLTYFHVLHTGITRKDMDGKVWGPNQAVSREAMLKAATIWPAYYAKKENKAGSLEVGKFADLSVLDQDFLTLPIDDTLKIHVLMTMVGGKVEHLVPSFAREIGMQPAGAQVELGGAASKW
jgi:predicted amidohydrolase YtcJ